MPALMCTKLSKLESFGTPFYAHHAQARWPGCWRWSFLFSWPGHDAAESAILCTWKTRRVVASISVQSQSHSAQGPLMLTMLMLSNHKLSPVEG